jgi:DNA-binding Lrp family transcriptional regulator
MSEKSINIDAYDRKILFELDKNARITATAIGKKIRKSKQFVDYRINRLEETKVLKGHVTIIDHSRLGYQSIRVYLKFHNITREQQDALEAELVQNETVWWVVTLEGPWDIGLAVAVSNVLDFYNYWDDLMKLHRPHIKKSSVVIYTHITQFPKNYLVSQENHESGTLVAASTQTFKTDKLDTAILKAVSGNARMPLLEIASKLKTSPQVVKNRLKALEKSKVIQGYRALIDVSFLGYRYYKSYISLTHTDRIKELHQFCLQHPNILNVNRTIGGSDFELELQAKSFDEFYSVMNKIRKEFAGMIEDYEFVIAREEKKMVYFPSE